MDLIPIERIYSKIFIIRGRKVMLDRDLAMLYGVETRSLVQAVARNKERFPKDFMFQLEQKEFSNLRSQFVMSSSKHGGLRRLPYVFTEQGVAMLSSVLRSDTAILVNIQVIRAFVQMRELIKSNRELLLKIESLEIRYDRQFKIVFDAIRSLMKEDDSQKPNEIGFRTGGHKPV